MLGMYTSNLFIRVSSTLQLICLMTFFVKFNFLIMLCVHKSLLTIVTLFSRSCHQCIFWTYRVEHFTVFHIHHRCQWNLSNWWDESAIRPSLWTDDWTDGRTDGCLLTFQWYVIFCYRWFVIYNFPDNYAHIVIDVCFFFNRLQT